MLDIASNISKRMGMTKKGFLENEENDAIDSYFECVTACSIEDKGVECLTRCVEVHLKSDIA